MSKSDECVFCTIASGGLGTELIYQDDQVVAFRDLHPVAPLHLLVIPREHVPTLDAANGREALLGRMLEVARRLAASEGVAEGGYRVVVNCQGDAGQVVFHLHLHVIGGRRLGAMA